MRKTVLQTNARPVERRRHFRVNITLSGRYMLEDKREFPCQTINMSPGGILVAGPTTGGIGERVVFYFDDFGRLEGLIIRQAPDGFAVTLTMPASKRERLADLLTWHINRSSLSMPEDRRHQRIIPVEKYAEVVTVTGSRIEVEVLDVSISGVGLRTNAKFELGARIEIGRRTGKVVRLFEGGLAVEFSRLIPVDEFDEEIIL